MSFVLLRLSPPRTYKQSNGFDRFSGWSKKSRISLLFTFTHCVGSSLRVNFRYIRTILHVLTYEEHYFDVFEWLIAVGLFHRHNRKFDFRYLIYNFSPISRCFPVIFNYIRFRSSQWNVWDGLPMCFYCQMICFSIPPISSDYMPKKIYDIDIVFSYLSDGVV